MSRVVVAAGVVGLGGALAVAAMLGRTRVTGGAPSGPSAAAESDDRGERSGGDGPARGRDDGEAWKSAAALATARELLASAKARASAAASAEPRGGGERARPVEYATPPGGGGGGAPASAPLPPEREPRSAANDISGLPEAKEMQASLLKQLKPILQGCYRDEVARGTAAGEDVGLYFHVSITPNLGAVVHSVELEAGTIDPAFSECIQESVGAIAPFDAGGPAETVLYVPLSFRPHAP